MGGLFLGTLDARLIALDLGTGQPCPDFGAAGAVNLLQGIEPLADSWEYNVTSPPTVVGDAVIVGSSIADMTRRIQPPGAVRAFDARTGRLLWRFNTVPRPGEFGAETWLKESWRFQGGANVWSTMTADLGRGLVFLPVSAVGPDFYGGDRPGANLFADSLVALEAKSGRRVWHFQTVHHDLWDYDLAAPPNLVQIVRDGVPTDAVAQATKTGWVFLLDRDTGKPLFPVEERPVPRSDVAGEVSWPTQPFPLKPPALAPQHLTEADLWQADARRLNKCRQWLRELRKEGIPCNAPPWGFLVAVDLSLGEIRWKVPVGEDQNGVRGLPNFGPPLVTAGGLVFHAGSRDLRLRAHDASTGQVLAAFNLPAGLHAGPVTYKLGPDHRQYLVVAPGGHLGLGSKLGDYVMAYTLPRKEVLAKPPRRQD